VVKNFFSGGRKPGKLRGNLGFRIINRGARRFTLITQKKMDLRRKYFKIHKSLIDNLRSNQSIRREKGAFE